MDETIDLRPYVNALVRRWWVILGAIIACILLAVILYASQAKYRATALIAVTDPVQRLAFDSRITSSFDLKALLQAYPELAMSDGVMSALLEKAGTLSGGAIKNIEQLRELVEVEDGPDPRLVRLAVRSEDPQLATDLANAWATVFVSAVDGIYGAPGGDVAFFNDQLAETDQRLRAAENALIEFQSGSRLGIVDNELLSLSQLQATYLADQRQLTLTIDDIHALRNQIEAGNGDSVTIADQLTALQLQLNVYESALSTSTDRLQLLINPEANLTSAERAEQIALLDGLARSAEAELDEIDLRLLELEPRIFTLQREKESLSHQYEELSRNRDVAEETYLTLARKIDEVRIQSSNDSNSLRVASLATVPIEPDRPNLFILIAIACLSGLLIITGILLGLTYWKNGNDQASG